MYNRIIILGHFTRDIELRYMPNGGAVANTGIATTRKFKDASGQQKEETCFVDLTFFGRTAEVVNQYLHKGSKVLIEGRLKLDQWQDQNGGKRSKHSVVVENMQMLDSKSDSTTPTNTKPPVEVKSASQNGALPEVDIDEDEIPF